MLTGNAPDFFCIVAEEKIIELEPETVHQEIFQAFLFPAGKEPCFEVREHDGDGSFQSQVAKGLKAELYRVAEKFSQEIDT